MKIINNQKTINTDQKIYFFSISRRIRQSTFYLKAIIRKITYLFINFFNPVERYLLQSINVQGGLAYKQQWYKRSDGIAYLVIFPTHVTRTNTSSNMLVLVIIKNLGIPVQNCSELIFKRAGINTFICNTKQSVDRVFGPTGLLFQIVNESAALATTTDRDLIAARLLAETHALQASGLKAFPNADYLTGAFDNEPQVKLRLEGIKHGRYLNQQETVEILTKPQHSA
jgi:hypothetical protein